MDGKEIWDGIARASTSRVPPLAGLLPCSAAQGPPGLEGKISLLSSVFCLAFV